MHMAYVYLLAIVINHDLTFQGQEIISSIPLGIISKNLISDTFSSHLSSPQ